MNIKRTRGNIINTCQNTKRSMCIRMLQNVSPVIKKLKRNQFFFIFIIGLSSISSTVGAYPLGNATISTNSDTIKVENGWANIYTIWYTLSNDADNQSIQRVTDRIYYIKKELSVLNSGTFYINSTDVDELRIKDIYNDMVTTGVYQVQLTSTGSGLYIRDVTIKSWNETINNYINNSYQLAGGSSCSAKVGDGPSAGNACLARPKIYINSNPNAEIINTTFLGMGRAIDLRHAANVQIINNTVNESSQGVYIRNASGATLTGNYFQVAYDGIQSTRATGEPTTDNVTVTDYTFDTTWSDKTIERTNNGAILHVTVDDIWDSNWTHRNINILNGGRNAIDGFIDNSVYENVIINYTSHNAFNKWVFNTNITNFTVTDVDDVGLYVVSDITDGSTPVNVTPYGNNFIDVVVEKSNNDCMQIEGYNQTFTNVNLSDCASSGIELYGKYFGTGYNASAEINQTWKNLRIENVTAEAIGFYWLGYGDNLTNTRVGGELQFIDVYINNITGNIWQSNADNGEVSKGTVQIVNTNDDTASFDGDTYDYVQMVFYSYVSVNVTDTSSAALNGVNVSFVSNETSISLLSSPKSLKINNWIIQNRTWTLTDANGLTPLPSNEGGTVAVPYKLVNKSGTYTASWNITASKFGYQTNSATVNPDVSWYRSNPNTYQNTTLIILSPSSDLISPTITIQSPESDTYANKIISLNYTADEALSTCFVSVDGTANATLPDCENQAVISREYESTTGISGWWHFNEDSGSSASDESGNDMIGVVNGASWVDGKFGKGLNFDGLDDYVEVNSSINTTGEITLEVWIKTSATARQTIFDKWLYGTGVDQRSFELDIDSDGRINFGLSGNGSTGFWLTSSKELSTNAWTHIAAVSDGTTMKIYINGEQDQSTATAPSAIYSSTANLNIGRWFSGGTWWYPFNGTMDEVRILNRALTEDEIKADYALGAGSHNITVYASDTSGNWNSTTRYFTVLYSHTLSKGWNTVNFTGYDNTSIENSLSAVDYFVIWGGIGDIWKAYIPGIGGNFANLTSGNTYLIYANSNTAWTYPVP